MQAARQAARGSSGVGSFPHTPSPSPDGTAAFLSHQRHSQLSPGVKCERQTRPQHCVLKTSMLPKTLNPVCAYHQSTSPTLRPRRDSI